MRKSIQSLLYTCVLCFAWTGTAVAEKTMDREERAEEQFDATETLNEAAQVVQTMKADPKVREQLSRADAVFIVPDYGKAALGIGASGGEGILMTKTGGNWSGPAFYNIGGIQAGIAAGVEAGAVAFMIMSDKAMAGFEGKNNFSLNADAGLTIVNWSEHGQASAGKGEDVIVWSDTEGLYGELALSVADIMWDSEANEAYYNRKITAAEVLSNTVKAPAASNPLTSEFSALEVGSETSIKPAKPMHENKERMQSN